MFSVKDKTDVSQKCWWIKNRKVSAGDESDKTDNIRSEDEKGEIYEGVIEKIDFQNKGRVKIKDTTVTVKMGFRGRK